MGKIFIKCKDKTSLCWLPAQGVKVVGDIPAQVDDTPEVNKRIKKGVLVKVDAKEYARVHNATKKSKEENLKLSIELFQGAITAKDIKLAEEQFKKAKSYGLSENDSKRFDVQVLNLKDAIKTEIEQEERTAKAEVLVQEAVANDVFTNNKGFFMLGRKRLGKSAEDIIAWAAKSDKNIDELLTAINGKKDEQ